MTMYDNNFSESDWFEDSEVLDEEYEITEYDITATPNDFNVITLHNFIESKALRIPGFQRNFVWDIKRASKLIESLILGLPVPQLFLYEKARNEFLVIDGQQRLMSIYYFVMKRFPRKNKQADIRSIFDQSGAIPEEIFNDEKYFQTFNLNLPSRLPDHPNRFHGLNYSTLDEYKTRFDLRPIRNIVIKQNSPSNDDSMYEIFTRLNTGGIILRPQEIRMSMYHSRFYELLYQLNREYMWRKLIGKREPDLHMKDIEILLRGFAILIENKTYKPSMVKFLNQFSKKCTDYSSKENEYLKQLFESFLAACSELEDRVFLNKTNNRFNIALYEAVFMVACERCFENKAVAEGKIDELQIKKLEEDEEFKIASLSDTTGKVNLQKRLDRARKIVDPLKMRSPT